MDPTSRAIVLTAAEWNDNENWPFFTNLVNAGTISFPSFGIDPRNRIDAWAAEVDAFVTLREQMDNYRALIGG